MSEPKRRHYTEFKTEVVRLVQETGKPIAEIARDRRPPQTGALIVQRYRDHVLDRRENTAQV